MAAMNRPGRLLRWSVAPALLAAAAVAAPQPSFRVAKKLSLELRDTAPTFACLDGLLMLDRNRLVQIGRPIERRNVFTVLDMKSLEIREIAVDGLPATQVPAKTEMAMDRPLFYDTDNGVAGMLLRRGGLVSGDAEYAEWDLRTRRITRRLPIESIASARWMSVQPIGYDPVRREAYVEVVRNMGPAWKTGTREGEYELEVIGISDQVRRIATLTTSQKFTQKSPYFDPVHRRSMHIEYAEFAGNISNAYLVDLDTGAVKTFPLPPVIYGFAFDPDGRTGYVYSFRDSDVLKLDLQSGTVIAKRKVGSYGHLLDFVAPNLLLLGRNQGMHFLDARTLKERWFLDPKKFHKVSAHLEGSIFLPGRALVRVFYELYVVDFPGLSAAPR